MIKSFHDLQVKIFADGADLNSMVELAQKPWVQGLTTNPTLMKKAGIKNYAQFAKEVLQRIPDKPISFEVFSDEFGEMARQALEIASWGRNVYVKIPITNTKSAFAGELIRKLSHQGVKLNVTAMFTPDQIVKTCEALRGGAPSNISIFAGRIADAGIDPLPIMHCAVACASTVKGCEVIWASPRELFNIVQASEIGCHIITVTPDILQKLVSIGKNLETFSLETVKMFYNDAQSAGFTI